MPVSHLALNVSRIQEAASFYLAALQPLGYKFIGHQGNSIGLGEKDADFFLCQQRSGRPSPTHIAFSAASPSQVRACYAAALNAGGFPSGAPSHRNSDCGCFNAAVEDLDGNTIEFILREPCHIGHEEAALAPAESGRVLDWQENVARSGADDAQSVNSRVSQAKSRARTALDLASTASKSYKGPSVSGPATAKPQTAGPRQESGGNGVVGTLLGAAAGAALVYAMCNSERENARAEAAFDASMRSRPLARSMSASNTRSRSNYEGTSTLRSNYEAAKSTMSTRKGHRNFSTTDSMHSSRYPPRSMPKNMQRMIEPKAYNRADDDSEIQEAISRYARRRVPPRSQTYDALDYVPAKTHVSSRSERQDLKRAATLPAAEGPYLLGAPSRSAAPSARQNSSRDSLEDENLKRHDSAVSVHSRHSEARRPSASKASTIKPSHRQREAQRDDDSKSRASTAKPSRRGYESRNNQDKDTRLYTSQRERRLSDDRASWESWASTAKPSSRAYPKNNSAACVPLPASSGESHYSAAESRGSTVRPSKRDRHEESNRNEKKEKEKEKSRPPPPPKPARYTAAGQEGERERERARGGERKNAIMDLETVLPEDSISCVDLSSSPQHSERERERERERKGGSRHGSSRRSEASTVKPVQREEKREREKERSGGRSGYGAVSSGREKEKEKEEKKGKRSLLSWA